ncbi:MAG: substrate-binding domain-containing protein, partial [Lachnospiraceae bacterium]|nr:substrate-binding domain-containing protein [Lachnospiraceae bacterium]
MMDNEEIGHLAEETLCDSGCRTVRMIACPEAVKALAIGNGEPEEAAFSVPSLSVISLPMEEMAEECLGILVDTLRNVLVEVETHSSQGSLQGSEKVSLTFSS